MTTVPRGCEGEIAQPFRRMRSAVQMFSGSADRPNSSGWAFGLPGIGRVSQRDTV